MKIVLQTAFRYMFSKKAGQRTSSVLILLSIVAGVAVMIVAAGIMNGLQTGQLDAIRAVSSFDLKVKTSLSKDQLEQAVQGRCFAFNDYPCMIGDNVMVVREIEEGWFQDPRVQEQIDSTINTRDGLILSFPVYLLLPTDSRSNVKITYLKHGTTATVAPHSLYVNIKGLFSCRLYDFASNYCFASMGLLGDSKGTSSYGVYTDLSTKEAAKRILVVDPSAQVTTWQQENNAVYSALVLEKALMFVFLGCIFLIICIGLGNSTRRLIEVRKREGAILKAYGMEQSKLYFIFLLQGMMLVALGVALGCTLGCILVHCIPKFLLLEPVISMKELSFICGSILLLFVLYTSVICRKVFGSTIREALEGVSC